MVECRNRECECDGGLENANTLLTIYMRSSYPLALCAVSDLRADFVGEGICCVDVSWRPTPLHLFVLDPINNKI